MIEVIHDMFPSNISNHGQLMIPSETRNFNLYLFSKQDERILYEKETLFNSDACDIDYDFFSCRMRYAFW